MIFPTTKGCLLVRSRIISIGSYLPERVLSNSDLEEMVDTSDEWITERTGIRERRIADESQAASDLAFEASKIALDRAGLSAADIEMIIVATVTGDMPFPQKSKNIIIGIARDRMVTLLSERLKQNLHWRIT